MAKDDDKISVGQSIVITILVFVIICAVAFAFIWRSGALAHLIYLDTDSQPTLLSDEDFFMININSVPDLFMRGSIHKNTVIETVNMRVNLLKDLRKNEQNEDNRFLMSKMIEGVSQIHKRAGDWFDNRDRIGDVLNQIKSIGPYDYNLLYHIIDSVNEICRISRQKGFNQHRTNKRYEQNRKTKLVSAVKRSRQSRVKQPNEKTSGELNESLFKS